ncbi:uncharacterized protein Fot_53575 [Forsythia ovata]|uniref:RING-CH-type domain-containing protein n=1 Tax=Forsythia ovata TaxID=205694 RepID=A0ABD1PJW7_9LAMI
MSSLEITRVDLECDHRSSVGVRVDADKDTDGDASYDDYNFACGSGHGEILVASGRSSSDCSSVDLETGKNKMHLEKVERDCRICHLSLVSNSPEIGVAIELGCFCKVDLATAHRHCAETWFKIKGNNWVIQKA